MTGIEFLYLNILDSPWLVADDLIDMGIKLFINLFTTFLIVKLIYRPLENGKEYTFTYFTFNVLIFFLCHLMLSTDLGLGFAFGLFALFSIMRYRTTTISIKNMTYLFAVVCIAVINALNHESISWSELLFVNGFIALILFILENSLYKNVLLSKEILFEDIRLVKEDAKEALIEELKNRTGMNIQRVDIQSINYLNDSALLIVHYSPL